jgi:hypothetical protein
MNAHLSQPSHIWVQFQFQNQLQKHNLDVKMPRYTIVINDASDSMDSRGDFKRGAIESMYAYASQLAKGGEKFEVQLVRSRGDCEVQLPMGTHTVPEVYDAAAAYSVGGRTSLYDTIYDAIGTTLPNVTLDIYVASDGEDNDSYRSLTDVLNLAKERNVTIHFNIVAVSDTTAGANAIVSKFAMCRSALYMRVTRKNPVTPKRAASFFEVVRSKRETRGAQHKILEIVEDEGNATPEKVVPFAMSVSKMDICIGKRTLPRDVLTNLMDARRGYDSRTQMQVVAHPGVPDDEELPSGLTVLVARYTDGNKGALRDLLNWVAAIATDHPYHKVKNAAARLIMIGFGPEAINRVMSSAVWAESTDPKEREWANHHKAVLGTPNKFTAVLETPKARHGDIILYRTIHGNGAFRTRDDTRINVVFHGDYMPATRTTNDDFASGALASNALRRQPTLEHDWLASIGADSGSAKLAAQAIRDFGTPAAADVDIGELHSLGYTVVRPPAALRDAHVAQLNAAWHSLADFAGWSIFTNEFGGSEEAKAIAATLRDPNALAWEVLGKAKALDALQIRNPTHPLWSLPTTNAKNSDATTPSIKFRNIMNRNHGGTAQGGQGIITKQCGMGWGTNTYYGRDGVIHALTSNPFARACMIKAYGTTEIVNCGERTRIKLRLPIKKRRAAGTEPASLSRENRFGLHTDVGL